MNTINGVTETTLWKVLLVDGDTETTLWKVLLVFTGLPDHLISNFKFQKWCKPELESGGMKEDAGKKLEDQNTSLLLKFLHQLHAQRDSPCLLVWYTGLGK